MDNRTLTAVILSLLVWYGWMVFFAPPPTVEADALGDTDAAVLAEAGVASDARDSDGSTEGALGVEAPPVVEAQELGLALCGMTASMSTGNGAVRALQLPGHEARYDIQPLWSHLGAAVSGTWKPYGDPPGTVELISDLGRAFVAGGGDAREPLGPVEVVEASDDVLTTRRVVEGRVEVLRTLRAVPGDPCRLELVVQWHNRGTTPWTRGLWVGVHDLLHPHVSQYDTEPRPIALIDGYLETWDDLDDTAPPAAVDGAAGAFGMAGHYFAAVALPASDTGRIWAGAIPAPEGTPTPEGLEGPARLHGVQWVDDAPLAAGADRTAVFTLFAGPKESDTLAAVDERLTSLISLGWLSFIAWPLLWLLKQCFQIAGNWGVAILLLVLLVKGLFFRMTQRAFESTQAMQALQPEVKRIQEQYKDNPEQMNQQMFALWKEHGVSPVGGCLPMLAQMPVWFALYSVLLSAVELYHTEFLYLHDLSQPDPYMISPAIVTGIMFGQQFIMPTANLDPAQARMMRIMPLVFGLLFFSFPSGLVIYIFVNTLLSMLQQLYIKRTFHLKAAVAEGTGGN